MRGLEGYSVATWMIVIFSDDWKDHMKHLRDVLWRLRKAGLTVKLDKCQFGMISAYILVMGGGMVRPENLKLEALKNFLIPWSERISLLGSPLLEVHTEFCRDSSSVVKSH